MLRRAAMSSASLCIVQDALESALNFLEPYLPLVNSCMVSFITANMWQRLVPPQLADELLSLPREQLLQLPVTSAGQLPAGPLDQFVTHVSRCRLSGCSVLSQPPSLDAGAPLMDRHFSSKKLHEVEKMSATVERLAADNEITQVVDMGSGKGYLSSMLALHHGLDVIAVEGSELNNHGARKVNATLIKDWDAIMGRTKALQQGETPERRSRKWKRMQKSAEASRPRHRPAAGRLTAVHQHVTSGTHLHQLLVRHGDPRRPLAVVGLHTCGDLAVHSLRMFTQLQQARLLVNVGCCYHLQREKYEGEFWQHVDTSDITFPISQWLVNKRCSLGQQARGLAAQAPERIAQQLKEPSPSLYWRAVLEVLVAERRGEELGRNSVMPNVGKLARRTKDYQQYMRRALHKLNIDEKDVSDAELQEYHDRFLEHRPRLEAFSTLRVTLAPVVEAVMLLDRLAFLLEQDSVETARLVQLFDPVISPRCYALIATKRRS